MSDKAVLALDLSSKTGWCYLRGTSVAGGVEHFKGHRVARAAAFRAWLEKVTAATPYIVAYERPFARGRDATRSLWGMAGIVEGVMGGRTAVLDVEVNTLKKWAGGKGGDKQAMIRRATELLGHAPKDDNHADAVCLAYYVAEKMEIED